MAIQSAGCVYENITAGGPKLSSTTAFLSFLEVRAETPLVPSTLKQSLDDANEHFRQNCICRFQSQLLCQRYILR